LVWVSVFSLESVNKSKDAKRSIVALWSASVVAIGIAILAWSIFGIRETLPPQAAPIAVSEIPLSPNVEVSPKPEAPVVEPKKVFYATRPELGDKVGSITLPTIDLSWPIYEGTEHDQLAKGVGHFVQSVLPGETDNTVLSGHRTTVFNRLGELKIDDLVAVKTSAGIFTYKVTQFRIVNRTDKTVIVPTDTAVLTITTCYPFDQIGATTKAFIVVADLVDQNLN
jgi:sortase A